MVEQRSLGSSSVSDRRLSSSAVPRTFAAVQALTWRELTRFFRQRSRVIGAVGQPIVFWFLFGAGLNSSFRAPTWAAGLNRELSYFEYFLPGIAALIVLFTAIFSTISIIEDRREGFLQGVLAAPVPGLAIVLGKLAAGTLLALMQAGIFLAVGSLMSQLGDNPGFSVSWSLGRMLLAAIWLMLVALELTALGFVIAWPINSTQGYHAIMSIFLMPMWLLSGAFFPGGESGWLHWLMKLNPLTYGVAGLRRVLYEQPLPVTAELPSLVTCVFVTLIATASLTTLACLLVSRPNVRNVA